MMRKIDTLQLAAGASNDMVKRGYIEIGKGKLMQGLRLKVTAPVANNSGGNAALTDAQKQALLGKFLVNLNYGANGQHKIFASADGARVHREARKAYRSELVGYGDSSTGLSKVITNTQTNNLVFYLLIPTGKLALWEPRIRMGMGRSQAKTAQFELRKTDDAIATGWTINGTVTADVIPDSVPCKGDRWFTIPEYNENDETNKTVKLPEGLPLCVVERSAVHASSALSNVTVKVDEEVIFQQLAASEWITQLQNSELLPTAGLLTDRETIMIDYGPEQKFADLPSGVVRITQDTKDLATFKVGYTLIPIKSKAEFARDLQFVTDTEIRPKTIKAVSLVDIDGVTEIPDRLRPFAGYQLVDTDDAEFQQYAGLTGAPGASPEVTVPEAVKSQAKAIADHYSAHKAPKVAEKVLRKVAAQAPGAVESGRGFPKGSGILESLRHALDFGGHK